MSHSFRILLKSYLPSILISLLFIVPLFNSSGMFNGIVSAKKYGFYIIMTIMMSYYSLLLLFEKKVEIRLNLTDLFFLLYVLWNLISAVLTNDAYINDKTGELVMLTGYYFIIKGHLSVAENKRVFFIITTLVLLTVAIIEVIVGHLQLYEILPPNNNYFKVTGTFHNPVPYGLFLTIVFAYALGVYYSGDTINRSLRYISLITSFLIVLIIPFTNNRASWLGIALCIFILFIIREWYARVFERIGRLKRAGLIIIISIIFLAGLFFLYNYKKESSEGRLLVWKVCGMIIKDNPVQGIGYGRFGSEYNNYQASYFKGEHNVEEESLADSVRYSFNDFIEISAETGFTGLILFTIFLFCVFFSIRRRWKELFCYYLSLTICLLLSAISYPLSTITTTVLFIFCAASLSSLTNNYRVKNIHLSWGRWIVVISLIALIVISVKQVSKYRQYKDLLIAFKETTIGSNEIAEEYFKKIEQKLKYEFYYSFLYAQCLIREGKTKDVIELTEFSNKLYSHPELLLLMGKAYQSEKLYDQAINCYTASWNMAPGRLLPGYNLTKLYLEKGDTIKASGVIDELLSGRIKIKTDSMQSIINEIKRMDKQINWEKQE